MRVRQFGLTSWVIWVDMRLVRLGGKRLVSADATDGPSLEVGMLPHDGRRSRQCVGQGLGANQNERRALQDSLSDVRVGGESTVATMYGAGDHFAL